MEETKNEPENEDVADSWTLVDKDDSEEGNANVETTEPSDSESLEVLEVEPEENSAQEDNESVGEIEDNSSECTVNDCDGSCVSEDSVIPLASVQKVKKYVHHPSAYINMWLSIVMVIAVAITLGLGIGHYLGSERFMKARDTIHLLKYENQILEQELANAVVKHKVCGNDLRDSIFGNLTRGKNKNVCHADEDPFMKKNCHSRHINIAMALLRLYNHYEQNYLHSSDQDVLNKSFLSTIFVQDPKPLYNSKMIPCAQTHASETSDLK